MLKKLFSVLTLIALTSLPALAENNATSGAVAGATSGAVSQNTSGDSNSVGLAGLAGGDCSEGITFGAKWMGFGKSALNHYCQMAKEVYPAFDRGLLTKAEGRALILASLKGLGFELRSAPPAVTASSMSASTPVIDLAAVVRSMNKTERAAYDACKVMQTGDIRFKKPGC